MPMDYSKYPKDWKQISLRIRERDGQCCKFCGVQNHILILRKPKSAEYLIAIPGDDGCMTADGQYVMADDLPDWSVDAKYTEVVLTVAHLGVAYPDGTPGNKHDKTDCRDENLAALCQRCHLILDMDEHVANRRTNKRRNHEKRTGQKPLFEVLK